MLYHFQSETMCVKKHWPVPHTSGTVKMSYLRRDLKSWKKINEFKNNQYHLWSKTSNLPPPHLFIPSMKSLHSSSLVPQRSHLFIMWLQDPLLPHFLISTHQQKKMYKTQAHKTKRHLKRLRGIKYTFKSIPLSDQFISETQI